MIDSTFVEKITSLVEPEIHEVNGLDYARTQMYLIAPPEPKPMQAHTLRGVADYARANMDADSIFVQVVSPDMVLVRSAVDAEYKTRATWLEATPLIRPFEFNRHLEAEQFIIGLLSRFVPSPVTDQLLRIVGNLEDGVVRQTLDDGVSQTVSAKVGIARVGEVIIPGRVVLAPFRTFAEVEQPASEFIFRMKSAAGQGSPTCALFEADGGAWKLECVGRIREWLAAQLEGVTILA